MCRRHPFKVPYGSLSPNGASRTANLKCLCKKCQDVTPHTRPRFDGAQVDLYCDVCGTLSSRVAKEVQQDFVYKQTRDSYMYKPKYAVR